MNTMQKYPHFIELFDCILNTFVFMLLCPINLLIPLGIYSTPKPSTNFNIFYMQSNPVCIKIPIFIKIYYIFPIIYSFREIISRINTINPTQSERITFAFRSLLKDEMKCSHNQLLLFLFLTYFHNQLLLLHFLLICFLTN